MIESGGLDALHESGDARTRFAALETKEAELLVRTDALESHDVENLDDIQRLEHKLGSARVEKEHHEAQDMETTKSVTATKDELAHAK